MERQKNLSEKEHLWLAPYPKRLETPRFIDLFCGIGGMRLAFEAAGCRCVFSSDWDVHAQKTYSMNFSEQPRGNIRQIDASEVPPHEILVAGLPCQPFSVSGVSKKNSLGRAHGFDDPTQGTLFFEIVRIIRDKKPDAFVLENVKNLKGHDQGRTFRVIMQKLEDELGYSVDYRVLDAQALVPQHRERIFIVGFRRPRRFGWSSMKMIERQVICELLERAVDEKYLSSDRFWN